MAGQLTLYILPLVSWGLLWCGHNPGARLMLGTVPGDEHRTLMLPFVQETASAGRLPSLPHFSTTYGTSEDCVPDPTLLKDLKLRVDGWGSRIPSIEAIAKGQS